MERLRQALAFPMYGAAAWLAWVLVRQAGVDAVPVALGGMAALGIRTNRRFLSDLLSEPDFAAGGVDTGWLGRRGRGGWMRRRSTSPRRGRGRWWSLLVRGL